MSYGNKNQQRRYENYVVRFVARFNRRNSIRGRISKFVQGHIALVKESMRMFSLSVNAKNFSEFHKSISRLWQREVTVSRLNQAFKPFMDNNINLLPLDNITPVFDVTPSVDDRGVLTIKGYYPTKPSRVTFEFGYVYEGASWKLARTKVNIKATQ